MRKAMITDNVGHSPIAPAKGEDDTRRRVIEALTAESRKVAGDLASFQYSMVSRLSHGCFLCACPEKPDEHAVEQHSGNKDTGRHGLLRFSPFYYYPFLFHGAFPTIPVEMLRVLASANRILMEAILIMDDRLDHDHAVSPMDLFLVDAYYQKTFEILIPFLPPHDPFWLQCEALFLEYGRAVLHELTLHRYRIHPYSLEEFTEVAVGKAGLIKTTVLALWALSGHTGCKDTILKSQEAFLAGFQAFDDLKDWREDYARQNYTCLLTSVVLEGGFASCIESGNVPDPGAVGRHLYYSGKAEAQLVLAEGLFQQSLDLVEGIDVRLWQEVVRGSLDNCHAMHKDLKEITNRERNRASQEKIRPWAATDVNSKAALEGLSESIASGVRFLSERQAADGSFPLASSPYSYMNPYTQLGPSHAITSLIRRALDCVPLHAGSEDAFALREKASTWIHNQSSHMDPSVPADLEESLRQLTLGEILQCEERYKRVQHEVNDGSTAAGGLFLANLLYLAAVNAFSLPSVESYVLARIQKGEFTTWSCSPYPPDTPHGIVRPIVCLSLLSKTLAVRPYGLLQAGKKELQRQLLLHYQTKGAWGDYTETALVLIGLLATGYSGPELRSAVTRLAQAQQPNGSWPPNAFYSKGGLCYGSREVCTAWCLEALCLYLQNSIRSTQHVTEDARQLEVPLPSITLHPEMALEILPHVRSVLGRCQRILPNQGPMEFYIGSWSSMPAHFIVAKRTCTRVGINVDPHSCPPRSVYQRSLEAEITLAHVKALRLKLCGAITHRLEHIFLAGIGILICRKLWSGQTPWEQCGMKLLEWNWCHENEWYLREAVKQCLHHKPFDPDCDPLSMEPAHVTQSPAPRNAYLYVGLQLFDKERKTGITEERVHALASWGLPEIKAQFQRFCGWEPKGKGFIF